MFPCNHWLKANEANLLLSHLEDELGKKPVYGEKYLDLKEKGEVLDSIVAITENRATVVIEYRIDDRLNTPFWKKRYPFLNDSAYSIGKKHRVVVSLSGDEPTTVNPTRAWRDFKFMVPHFPDIDKDGAYGATEYYDGDGRQHIWWKCLDDIDVTKKTSALIGFNPKYRFRHIDNTYYYDRNSAFTYSLMNCELPDMTKRVWMGEDPVKDVRTCESDEIGYWWNTSSLCYMASNKVGNIIFKKLPRSSEIVKELNHWGDYYYTKKAKYPNGTRQHKQAKDTLNITIGYMQRKNPFYRISAITYCNLLMMKAIRDCKGKAIYWNTDGIVTEGAIDCFPLSSKLGDFKIERQGGFYMDGITYQMEGEDPVQRGIPKGWYREFERRNGRKFDLEKDALPTEEYNIVTFEDGRFKELRK